MNYVDLSRPYDFIALDLGSSLGECFTSLFNFIWLCCECSLFLL